MKSSDIDDQHVIDLAQAWRDNTLANPGVLQALVSEGVPKKLALSKIEHLSRRGLLEYGTSPAYAWPA